MKVLITGRSGVGKSTTIKALEKRDFRVYDTDEMPEVSRLEVKATGEPTTWPEGYVDWSYYAWNWQEDGLVKLLGGNDSDVIIGAVMSNQHDFYHLFDLIILLTISPNILRYRLENRAAHTYGQDKQNIERAVERHDRKQRELATEGIVTVDNNRPTEEVIDEIAKIIDEHRNLA